ncbi:hypothetical protein [Kitasatospora sp. NPDC096140]|uniref:hypothetical protein n=1 Tax=Kitasatospora sp. NPDC096140 TaxID=3155425 RepID=UPI00332D7E39
MVKNGAVQVGSQPLNGSGAGTTTWASAQALPAGASPACSVSVVDQGDHVILQAITTNGVVYQTSCTFASNTSPVSCPNPWALLSSEPARQSESGAPPFGTGQQRGPAPAEGARSIKVSWEPYVRRPS